MSDHNSNLQAGKQFPPNCRCCQTLGLPFLHSLAHRAQASLGTLSISHFHRKGRTVFKANSRLRTLMKANIGTDVCLARDFPNCILLRLPSKLVNVPPNTQAAQRVGDASRKAFWAKESWLKCKMGLEDYKKNILHTRIPDSHSRKHSGFPRVRTHFCHRATPPDTHVDEFQLDSLHADHATFNWSSEKWRGNLEHRLYLYHPRRMVSNVTPIQEAQNSRQRFRF